jgi:hypothetical protein
MPRVIHFEITADDPQRAVNFYTNVFGWKAEKWPGPQDYWLISTGASGTPGIDGGIAARQGTAGHVNTIDVPSVTDYVGKITAAGGEIAIPKHAIPGIGFLAYCKDTEGSTFAILEPDPSAE